MDSNEMAVRIVRRLAVAPVAAAMGEPTNDWVRASVGNALHGMLDAAEVATDWHGPRGSIEWPSKSLKEDFESLIKESIEYSRTVRATWDGFDMNWNLGVAGLARFVARLAEKDSQPPAVVAFWRTVANV
jgi:hypothetical protein